MYNRYIVVGMVMTNCYIVAADDSDRCVVIDPGDDVDRIIEAIGQSGKKLSAVLLTHGHFDHIGAIEGLRKYYGDELKVYASEAEKELLATPAINCSSSIGHPQSVIADVYFADGDIISEAGIDFKVIATPGHTIGSVCFYVKAEKVLFSGDTLFEMSVGRTDLPTGSGRTLTESIQKRLYVLEDDVTVYPGHGGSTDIGFEKHNNMYV